MCAIRHTGRDITKCYECSLSKYVDTKTVTLCEQDIVQLWAACDQLIWLYACGESGLEQESLHWLRQVSSFKSGICGI